MALQKLLSQSRFAALGGQKFYWEDAKFLVPKGATVELYHTPSSPNTGPEKRGIRIKKPMFFTVDIQLGLISMHHQGLPPGLWVSPEEANEAATVLVEVVQQARFERLTAGNTRTDEYRIWAAWLFERLHERLEVN